MKIENIDVVGSLFVGQQYGLAGQRDLGMVFRAANPIWAANDNQCAHDAREAA